MKLDIQVDMIEFKEYGEIDLEETPVIALACRHFFTAQTLDGTYGLGYKSHRFVSFLLFEDLLELHSIGCPLSLPILLPKLC